MSVSRWFAGLLVLVALFALVRPVDAKVVTVPFKAVGVTTSETPIGGDGQTWLKLFVTGKGHGTHLGRMTSSGLVTLDFVSGTFQGQVTMVAANGDQLHLVTSGNLVGGAGGYAITGGTGRFAGATGTGSFTKIGVTGTFDGFITLIRGN